MRTHTLLVLTLAAFAAAPILAAPAVPSRAETLQNLPQRLASLPTADGAPAATYLERGKPTLIKYWASWCPLCLATLEETAAWHKNSAFKDINLISIASPGHLGEQEPAAFRSWISGLKTPYPPVLINDGGDIARDSGVAVYPSWVLLDARGNIARVIKGHITRDQALALIKNPEADISAQTTHYTPKAQGAQPMTTQTIYLAGGCFWGL